MAIRPYCQPCFSTGLELDDPVAADHEAARFGRERVEAVPAGAVAKR